MVTGGYSPGYGPVDDAPETYGQFDPARRVVVTRSELSHFADCDSPYGGKCSCPEMACDNCGYSGADRNPDAYPGEDCTRCGGEIK